MTKLWRPSLASINKTPRPPRSHSIVFLGTAHDNGGSSILAGNLAHAMRAAGHRVEEWYLFDSPSGVPAGARLFSAGGRARSPFKLAVLFVRVIAALRSQKPDTLFGLQSLSNLIIGIGGWLAGVPNRVATHHNPASLLDPLLMRIDAVVGRLGFYTRIIACAASVGESFERNGDAYCRRMRVIPNGQKKPVMLARDDARSQLGLTKTGTVIGQIGRFCEQKNQGFSVDLLKDIPSATLLFVGTGPDENAVKANVTANGLSDRVHFVTSLPYQRIGAFYSAVDAVIFPSRFEGLSLAAIEAIHAGVPFVASDIASFRELFRDAPDLAKTLLVPLTDRALWISRLRALLDDAKLRAAVATEFARLSPAFDFDVMAKRYLAALD
ncbi:MAG: glycosyltransferase family 4 protein [Rhizobiales bacterium]|nr:glycosyltransferase family 4 protein [Hyphomicrobiales bacterium]